MSAFTAINDLFDDAPARRVLKGDKKRKPEPAQHIIELPGGAVEVSRLDDGSYWAHIIVNRDYAVAGINGLKGSLGKAVDSRVDWAERRLEAIPRLPDEAQPHPFRQERSMTAKPCIVVAGMGRCGTSLMMQMLEAGGVPCHGTWPAFETDDSLPAKFDAYSFELRRDQAIKLIDSANLRLGRLPHHIVIWMDRIGAEQARSQLKLLQASGEVVGNSRRERRSMERALRNDRARHRAALGIPGRTPSTRVAFETLLSTPYWTANAVVGFLMQWGWTGIDAYAMAQQVIQRPATCYPGMLEVEMLARRGLV